MIRPLLVSALLPGLLLAAACSSEDSGTAAPPAATASGPSSAPSSGTTPAADAVTVPVTISGGEVTPNGDRIAVPVGSDVVLQVTADAPGEIHVHSSPEQEFEYAAGSSTLTITGLDRPGIVEVESHTLDKVIAQLQVS